MSEPTDREHAADEMINAAVRKAIEVGLLTKADSIERVARNWANIRDVVEAALAADGRHRPGPGPVSTGERRIEITPAPARRDGANAEEEMR